MYKVLHVVGRRPKGGIGTFLKNMVSASSNVSFHYDFLLNSNDETGEFDNYVEQFGSKVYTMPELSLSNIFKYRKKLTEFYNINEYDIIHIHSPNIVLFNLLNIKKNKNAKIVVHSHSSQLSDTFYKSIRNFFLNLPLKIINCERIACGEKAGKFLFGKKDFSIVYNGINVEKYKFNSSSREEVRNELKINEKIIIGHVGNYFKVKNHGFIVELARSLKEKHPDILFLFVGDGDEKVEIERKIIEYGLESQILVLGRRIDIDKLMSAFDIFILPSIFEGFPLVGLEAQASGLECVFSKSITTEIDLTQRNKFLNLDVDVWNQYISNQIEKKNYSDNDYLTNRIKLNHYVHQADYKNMTIEIEKIYVSLMLEEG